MKRTREDCELHIDDLDDDSIGEIFDTLSKDDTCSRYLFAAVCKTWRRIAGYVRVPINTPIPWAAYAMEHDSSHAFLQLIVYVARYDLGKELASRGRLADLQWAYSRGCLLLGCGKAALQNSHGDVVRWVYDLRARVDEGDIKLGEGPWQ